MFRALIALKERNANLMDELTVTWNLRFPGFSLTQMTLHPLQDVLLTVIKHKLWFSKKPLSDTDESGTVLLTSEEKASWPRKLEDFFG